MRGILNEGFRTGGNVRKVEGKNHELRTFKVFGPKAIAGIGKVPDTVASRCITIEMRRKTASERVEPMRLRDVRAAARPLSKSLGKWAGPEKLQYLRDARPNMPEELTDRQKDISEPLLAIADLAGGEWPHLLRRSLVALFGSASAEDYSYGVMLLCDIRSIFGEREECGPRLKGVHSADLASALCQREGRPWAEWSRGRGLDSNRLAKLLKRYGISPQSIRLTGVNQKGYWRNSFDDAIVRYCPPSSTGATPGVTAVTSCIDSEDSVSFCPVTDGSQGQPAATGEPAPTEVCDAVTATGPLARIKWDDALMLEGEL